jgi:hypothetical protein
MSRRIFGFQGVGFGFILVGLLLGGVGRAAENAGFVPLFNGRDLAGWVPVQVAPSTFTVQDGMIICTGKPIGVLRTDRMYENFILELEWRHMVPNGNAGLFIWSDALTARGQPFTRSIEVQILDGPNGDGYTTHGDVFAIHGATLKPGNPGKWAMRSYPTEHRSNPSPQWNHYRVEAVDGAIRLAVNGKVVTTASEASPRKGYICLESEGGVVHYRNIRIRELPSSGQLKPEQIARDDGGFKSIYNGVDLTGWNISEAGRSAWRVNDWRLAYNGQAQGDGRIAWTAQRWGEIDLIADVQPNSAARILLGGGDGPVVEVPAGKGWVRVTATIRGGRASAAIDGRPALDGVPAPAGGSLGLSADGPASFANIYVRPAQN